MRYLVFIGMIALLSGCGAIRNWYIPDNIVEEFVEEVIEAKTGLDLDLSPGSPEVE